MKIFCIGRNYAAHAKELNNDIPDEPLVFCKPHSAVLKNRKPFFHPNFSNNIHHEVELVLRICRNGRHIDERFAHKYYDRITVGLDLTARDIQNRLKAKGHPWEIAKGFDGSAPLGEFISLDEIDDVNNIDFSLVRNGEIAQQGNTKDLLFSFDKLISYISKYFILHQGDYIFTGTPKGVSKLNIGDRLEAFIGDKKLLETRVL
ncbi:MAG: fumarylacetoacetate hydrolase family protein [Chitinophagales bacterium]